MTEEPKCPECGSSALRPKCLFEMGSSCPRHEVAREYRVQVAARYPQSREEWLGPDAQLAEANARAEHWAAQADRLARQVERMREAILEAAEMMDESRWSQRAEWLRAAAKGGGDAE